MASAAITWSRFVGDDLVPPGLKALMAIMRGDEPAEAALDYAKTAADSLTEALRLCRDDDGALLIPPAAFARMAEARVFLIALQMAADPKIPTARVLAFPKRKGRPRRSREKVSAYRHAALLFIKRKSRGYDAALLEVAKETGLDNAEIEAWAAHLEAEYARLGLPIK